MSAIWGASLTRDELLETGQVSGVLYARDLPRVAEATLVSDSPLSVELQFELRGSQVLVSGTLTGQVLVRCQRCLEPMRIALDSRMAVALSFARADAAPEPEGYEVLSVEETVRLADLVEDEILLAVPLSARHEQGQCGALAEKLKALSATQSGQATTHPFAGLGDMMRNKRN